MFKIGAALLATSNAFSVELKTDIAEAKNYFLIDPSMEANSEKPLLQRVKDYIGGTPSQTEFDLKLQQHL